MPLIKKLFKKTKTQGTHISSYGSGSPAAPPVSASPTDTATNQQQTVLVPSADTQQTIQAAPQSIARNRNEELGLRPIHIPISASDDGEDIVRTSLDIVAIHGITGNAYGTWIHDNGTFWLQDLIPKDLPGVRVFSYGYPADVFRTFATGTIDTYARSLLESLKRERRSKDQQKRPIILICHSMGGIIAKKALVLAKIEDELYQSIRTSVHGIIFLATPHRGSGSTQFPSVLTGIANIALTGTSRLVGKMRSDLIEVLKKDSQVLKDISTNFRNQANSFYIASFIEQDITPPLKSRVVDDITGVMDVTGERYVPMQGCDHRSICRFSGKDSESYKVVLNVLQDWTEKLTELSDDGMTSEDLSCLRSLAFPEISYRRQEADKAFLHTCEWILQHKSYKAWGNTQHELLWIKGNPGSGKSTLMAYIYRELQKYPPSKRCLNLDFFFHGRGTELQKTPVGMFQSLLHQIYDKVPPVRAQVQAVFGEKRKLGEAGTGWQWQRKELEDLFSDAVIHAAKSREITIFVDALDEAGAEAKELAIYFHELNNKLAAGTGTAKICISCRHYPIAASNTSLNVHVEEENRDDIAKYIEHRLDTELPRRGMSILSPQECQMLKEDITRRASGIFMWARLIISLVVGFILDGMKLSYINDEIDKVPPDLSKVYEHILERVIPRQYLTQTLLLMQWICLAEQPLSVTELRYAMALDNIQTHQATQFCEISESLVDTDTRMQKQITSLSGGLIEVKQHSTETTVQFIHQTVNDFLRSKGLKYLTSATNHPQSHSPLDLSTDIVIGQSHNRLCKSCINYLRLDEVLQATSLKSSVPISLTILSLKEKLPFTLYATRYWFMHAEKAEGLGVPHQDLVQQLGFPLGPTLQAWIKIFHELDWNNPNRPQRNTTLLHIASGSNLRSAVRALLEDNVNVDIQDGAGNTALHYAARWGHADLVKILLDASADMGAQNEDQNTALERAAANGHGEILRLLLHRGADINSCTGHSGNALQAAAGEGKYIVVRILLDNGANVNDLGGYYGNALQAASYEANEAIVKLLLDKQANVNTQGGYYGNALQAASCRGNEAIVRLLLNKQANVNAQGGEYGNALQAAASYQRNKVIVKLLLDKQANVNAQGGYYGNALQVASYGGNEVIVKLLLDNGANVNAQGGHYGNALQAASYQRNEAIVKLLLDKQANVNTQGGYFCNALQAAALTLENEAIVNLLLDKQANVNAQGGYYGNALQAASYGDNEAIVKLLLDTQANVNAQGGRYGNALQAASCRGNEAIVKLLLDKQANVNAQGGHYGSALQAASYEGNEAIVKLLLDKQADANAQGGYYGNALQAAALTLENEAIVKLLLDKQANVNAQGGYYGNALQAASCRENEAIVKLLLDKQANVNAQGGYYGNALQAASCRGNEAIVKLLLDKQADANAQGGYYGNAL